MINADEVFKTIVNSINTEQRPVYFFTGWWPDFANELKTLGSAKSLAWQRYPLIFMDSNFEKTQQNDRMFSINPTFYVITQTKTSYNIQKRLDEVYKPILNPILEDFFKAIKNNKQIHQQPYFDNTQKNLYFLQTASAEQNQICDVVDAIKISFKSITIKSWQLC